MLNDVGMSQCQKPYKQGVGKAVQVQARQITKDHTSNPIPCKCCTMCYTSTGG